MKNVLTCALLVAATQCGAATLAANSFICEGDAELLLPVKDQWADLSGSGAMKSIESSIAFSKLMITSQQAFSDLAVQEERLRAQSRYLRGSTGSQQAATQGEQQSHAAKLSTYERMKATCAATGASALPAEVTERRGISGLVRVKIMFNGAPADVWTYSRSVTD